MNNTPTPSKNETAVRLYDEAQVFEGSRPSGLLIKGGDEILRLERELAAVTEQRDEYKAALQSADNHNHEIATKLEIVTEQRDRLAEALQKLNEYDLGDIPVGVVRRCEEVLQSLNPDHTVAANDMIPDVKGGADE